MLQVKSFVVVLLFLLTMMLAVSSQATIEAVEFDNPELLERYQDLIAELRCTVCQNQNLADSDADLAKDLRRKTEEMLKAGKSDADVLAYMRERYGDFVLYRPPLNTSTYVLWLGPFILLVTAALSILITIRNKQNITPPAQLEPNENEQRQLDHQEQQLKKIRKLLND